HGGDTDGDHAGDGAVGNPPDINGASKRLASSGTPLRPAQPQGVPEAGPLMIGRGRMAEQMVQVTYNAQHKIPWHWPVPAYLVTKGIAAGIFLLLAIGYGLGLIAFDAASFVGGGLLSVLFTLVTTGLLVYDLERPERFLRIVFRPQWRSWLVRGAFLLIGFSTVVGAWWILEAGALLEFWSNDVTTALRLPLLWIGAPLALGTAVYTAFLFGQAEGRDLWQSTLLPAHLIVQALMAGSAVMLLLDAALALPADVVGLSAAVFFGTVVFDLIMVVAGEFGMPHASEAAARAAHEISHGRYRRMYRFGVLLVGHALPLLLWAIGGPIATAVAAVAAVIGLYLYEYAFVMAPQEVPNS
ncbi:MAG: polysulfide reductase NrfD, partial [Rhodothermia bacterium]|nr:polysulfide reductase NrfD [Rhodothermia bacterium]